MAMAPRTQDSSFAPPSADQVQDWLSRHEARDPAALTAWWPILALGAALLLTFGAHEGMLVLAPWLILGAVFFAMNWRVRRLRHLELQVGRVHELAMTRHWPQSLRLAWRLIPSLQHLPELHGRTVAMLALGLDQVRAYDAALVAYDHVIERLPGEHPGSVHLRVQRTMVHLAMDQLSDADEALRRLRGSVQALGRGTIAATYRLALLVQQVTTHHFADAVDQSPSLLDDLRPLGVDAGYGHALMALSYQQVSPGPQSPQEEQARQWWARATLLLPPSTLVGRFQQLQPLAQALPAAARPVPRLEVQA